MTGPARTLLLGGAGAAATGQAAVAAAFLAPALFTPGVWLIGFGLLACAAAGVLALVRPAAEKAPHA